MNDEQLRKKVAKLTKQRKDLDREIEKLQSEIAQKLCLKKKKTCEPAYCIFRMTNSCPFLVKWRSIAGKIEGRG